jgi:hypothetical protein
LLLGSPRTVHTEQNRDQSVSVLPLNHHTLSATRAVAPTSMATQDKLQWESHLSDLVVATMRQIRGTTSPWGTGAGVRTLLSVIKYY